MRQAEKKVSKTTGHSERKVKSNIVFTQKNMMATEPASSLQPRNAALEVLNRTKHHAVWRPFISSHKGSKDPRQKKTFFLNYGPKTHQKHTKSKQILKTGSMNVLKRKHMLTEYSKFNHDSPLCPQANQIYFYACLISSIIFFRHRESPLPPPQNIVQTACHKSSKHNSSHPTDTQH